jgi:hypothetical protein
VRFLRWLFKPATPPDGCDDEASAPTRAVRRFDAIKETAERRIKEANRRTDEALTRERALRDLLGGP